MATTETGGSLLARLLVAEGVDTVFGIIDGTYFGLYSSFPDVGIRLVSPRHESSAAHMAGAYARQTGRLGVCIASNGPGVANILPGVAVENGEGNRVLLITSSRRTGIGMPDRGGTFQYFDQVAVTRPMTKWSGRAPTHDRIPELFRRALRISHRGRPGVVHLDVPENVINAEGNVPDGAVRPPSTYRSSGPPPPDPRRLATAADLLATAEMPLIHAGTGVYHAGAEEALLRLARVLEAPVTTSWGARGAVPETEPYAVPMVHIEAQDRIRNDADLVVVVGSRLGETDWWGKPPNWAPPDRQQVVQIDVDEENIGLNREVAVALQTDAAAGLTALADALEERAADMPLEGRRARLRQLQDALRADRAKLAKPLTDDRSPVHPARVPAICQQTLPEDTLWVFDGGNTTVWAQFYHQARRPRSILSTFKFGMLGAGVGQALGARVAMPDRPVCCIIGDGAMGMHPQEIETAVRHGLPVLYVVLCDRQWGMVKMSQKIASRPVATVARRLLQRPTDVEGTVFADLHEIRFDRVATAMGGHGEHVDHPDQLAPALERSLASGLVAVVHVDVDQGEHLWAPGLRAFKKMHEEPAG